VDRGGAVRVRWNPAVGLNFNSVSFSAASASQGGQTVNLSDAAAQPITLLNVNNQRLAVPPPIGSDGSSFAITRMSALATTGRRASPREEGPPRD
jgi:hypothetical protein